MTVVQSPPLDTDSLTHLAISKDGVWRTLQGEGPNIGRPTTFIRLAGCNLACTWCDTAYTWDFTGKNGHVYEQRVEVQSISVPKLFAEVMKVGEDSITITGGEPLLQWRALETFFKYMMDKLGPRQNVQVNFETNGTVYPKWSSKVLSAFNQPIHYVVSPKLRNADNPALTELQFRTLAQFVRSSYDFKFVCESSEDFEEIEAIIATLETFGSWVDPSRVWIMPRGVEIGVMTHKMRELAEGCIARNWNLTPRMHIQIWDNSRAH